MSFEEDNLRTMREIVFYSGEDIGHIRSNRNWNDSQLKEEFGAENVSELESRLSNPSTLKVLEIGCGQGKTLEHLRDMYSHIQYYGIDIALPKFTNRNIEGVQLYKMDAHKLDFPEEHFDIIISAFAFQYIVDKLKGLREAYRVLKKNGKGIVTIDPSYFHPDGESLIPTNSQASDVFWDDRRKAILINKKGKGISDLEQEYIGCKKFSDGNHFTHSVMSYYK